MGENSSQLASLQEDISDILGEENSSTIKYICIAIKMSWIKAVKDSRDRPENEFWVGDAVTSTLPAK